MTYIKNTIKTISILLVMFFLVTGCTSTSPQSQNNTTNQGSSDGNNADEMSQPQQYDSELKKFSSEEEVKEYILKVSSQMQTSNRYYTNGDMALKSTNARFESNDASMDTAESSSQGSSEQGATDYSETNIQVEGVDEADIVKNDGKYIYTISNKRLIIVDAYPAENSQVLSEIEFENAPQELFINDDKTVVFTQGYEEIERVSDDSFIPQQQSQQMTNI